MTKQFCLKCRGAFALEKKLVWVLCDECGQCYHQICVGVVEILECELDVWICKPCLGFMALRSCVLFLSQFGYQSLQLVTEDTSLKASGSSVSISTFSQEIAGELEISDTKSSMCSSWTNEMTHRNNNSEIAEICLSCNLPHNLLVANVGLCDCFPLDLELQDLVKTCFHHVSNTFGLSTLSQWYFVLTESCFGSYGMEEISIIPQNWLDGPSFLQNDVTCWPSETDKTKSKNRELKIKHNVTSHLKGPYCWVKLENFLPQIIGKVIGRMVDPLFASELKKVGFMFQHVGQIQPTTPTHTTEDWKHDRPVNRRFYAGKMTSLVQETSHHLMGNRVLEKETLRPPLIDKENLFNFRPMKHTSGATSELETAGHLSTFAHNCLAIQEPATSKFDPPVVVINISEKLILFE